MTEIEIILAFVESDNSPLGLGIRFRLRACNATNYNIAFLAAKIGDINQRKIQHYMYMYKCIQKRPIKPNPI